MILTGEMVHASEAPKDMIRWICIAWCVAEHLLDSVGD
jgi:hypothetical protein